MKDPDPLGLAGQVVEGPFRLLRPIGKGGFSVVYRGTHLGSDTPVAVKCLRLAAGLDEESTRTVERRFRDEGRLLRRLGQGSPDTVRCLASGMTTSPRTGAPVPYLVLEWLEGRSLSADLRERKQRGLSGRPLDEALALLEPAAIALEHAHRQGVVHRDVKPGNLFEVTTPGGGVRMKVLDFGLAKILADTLGITRAKTATGYLACSPRYAAPEQFDSSRGEVGPWTDVYALALVLLEVLRDERVRKAEGIAACMMEATDPRAKVTPHALGLVLPTRVERALVRAVAIDLKLRHQSAGELWADLTRVARASGQLPPPSSSGSLPRSVPAPPPASSSVPIAFGPAPASGPAPAPAPGERSARGVVAILSLVILGVALAAALLWWATR